MFGSFAHVSAKSIAIAIDLPALLVQLYALRRDLSSIASFCFKKLADLRSTNLFRSDRLISSRRSSDIKIVMLVWDHLPDVCNRCDTTSSIVPYDVNKAGLVITIITFKLYFKIKKSLLGLRVDPNRLC